MTEEERERLTEMFENAEDTLLKLYTAFGKVMDGEAYQKAAAKAGSIITRVGTIIDEETGAKSSGDRFLLRFTVLISGTLAHMKILRERMLPADEPDKPVN